MEEVAIKLTNHATGEVFEDTLNRQSTSSGQGCLRQRCTASVVFPPTDARPVRTKDEVKTQAKEFLHEYFSSLSSTGVGSDEHTHRWDEVEKAIDEKGWYDLTLEELSFGVKTAWRNAPRCIGRIQWNKIHVFDCRNVETPEAMFDAICKHLEFASNNGNIKSTLTAFRPRLPGKKDFRVWNQQLIQYAGYKMPDGTIVGDPGSIEFTEFCQSLGWKSNPGTFNPLPLVLSADGGPPEVFEIPSELILTVKLVHPSHDWFAQLGLEWFAVPAVSNILLDCGGMEFPACPFNGWYMENEIGCRNLGDAHRYNKLPIIAEKLKLDKGSPTHLWMDTALVELNKAVLHSFKRACVTIVDHHSASEQFMRHFRNENKNRGGCPADWIWVVPPMSGSLTEVYHQEMACYQLKPSFDYQDKIWTKYQPTGEEKVHQLENVLPPRQMPVTLRTPKVGKPDRPTVKNFKVVATAVFVAMKLLHKILAKRKKVTILFATETGKSENFARKIGQTLSKHCKVRVSCTDDYDIRELRCEQWVLVITSTFGSGEPPENGASFSNQLQSMKTTGKFSKRGLRVVRRQSFMRQNSTMANRDSTESIANNDTSEKLKNLSFAVFGLGSSSYPNFCAFGHYVNNLLGDLGARRLLEIHTGDEMHGQDQSFAQWADQIYELATAGQTIGNGVGTNVKLHDIPESPNNSSVISDKPAFEVVERVDDFVKAISTLYPTRHIQGYKIIQRDGLDADNEKDLGTIHVTLQSWENNPLEYEVGDHVGLFPCNSVDLVKGVTARLIGLPTPITAPVFLKNSSLGSYTFPRCTVKELLTRYLDISQPPNTRVLEYFLECTVNEGEKARLRKLVENGDTYQRWKDAYWPTLLNLLEEFPNVKPDAATLCSILPKLQPRFYSVSSSSSQRLDEIQLTVGLVEFEVINHSKRFGVCSSFLNEVPLGTILPCFVRTSEGFHLPEDVSKPMILVGPGSGIAPFKGFCDEMQMKFKKGIAFGQVALYHGCRYERSALYKQEMTQLRKVTNDFKFKVAYSRVDGMKKMYVQDLLLADAKVVVQKIMEEGGHVYVCGDANMAEGVYKTVRLIIKEHYKMKDEDAEKFMLQLRDENRYHEDIFGALYKVPEYKNVQNLEPRPSFSLGGVDIKIKKWKKIFNPHGKV